MSNTELNKSCQAGDTTNVKTIIESDSNIDISEYEYAFRTACSIGYIDIVELLLKHRPDINIKSIQGYAFKHACYNGHLHIAQKLMSIDPTVKDDVYANHLFQGACRKGFFEMAKWLLEIYPDIDILANRFAAHKSATECGHTDIAKWLIKLKCEKSKHKIEIDFKYACLDGDLELAQSYYKQKPKINIRHNYDCIFRTVCKNGHLHVAKWLMSVCPDIDIYNLDNNNAFYNACKNGHLDVAKWLKSLDVQHKYNSTYAMIVANKYGRQNIVDWINSQIW